MTQSEQELEQNLIERLTGLGYEPVTIRNAKEGFSIEIPIEPYPAQKLRNLKAKKNPPKKDGTLALRYTPLITNNY